MLRHELRVHAPLRDVLRTLDQTDFVSATTDGYLNVVHFAAGIGTARDVAGATSLVLFDDHDGVDVARIVDCLRGVGLDVDQEPLD